MGDGRFTPHPARCLHKKSWRRGIGGQLAWVILVGGSLKEVQAIVGRWTRWINYWKWLVYLTNQPKCTRSGIGIQFQTFITHVTCLSQSNFWSSDGVNGYNTICIFMLEDRTTATFPRNRLACGFCGCPGFQMERSIYESVTSSKNLRIRRRRLAFLSRMHSKFISGVECSLQRKLPAPTNEGVANFNLIVSGISEAR